MSYSPIPIRTSGGNMLSMVVALTGALSLILVIALPTTVEAYPVNNNFIANDMGQRKHPITVEIENPEEVLSVLDNLMQNILVGIDYTQSHGHNGNGPQQSNNSPLMSILDGGSSSNSKNQAIKRGIDLGLSRGFSGSQAAKHLMGMSAASFANGPGRR